MLADIADLALGAAGTALYLYAWNRALARAQRPPSGEPLPARLRQRRRIVQLLFFLLLTPYVLVLYRLMESLRSLLAPGVTA